MQYRIGQKLQPDDLKLSMNNIRGELTESIQYEHKRANVDNAKKRACVQLMDYHNFEQMVLGANLLPVKTKQVQTMFDMDENQGRGITNYSRAEYNPKIDYAIQLTPNDRKNQYYFNNNKNEVFTVDDAASFREFKQIFDSIIPSKKEYDFDCVVQLVAFIRTLEGAEKINKIFTYDFDINYLAKAITVFNGNLISKNSEDQKLGEDDYIEGIRFLQRVSESKYFKASIKSMLKKPEKQLFRNYIQRVLENCSISEEDNCSPDQVLELYK